MSRRFARPMHAHVLAVLERLDAAFLERSRCYFGGGTRIVLELGEYRESRDVDFLCADVAGYRRLRESITERSLGPVARKSLEIARDIRADQYGIRTRVGKGDTALKLEIVREARIGLSPARIDGIPVPCLSHESAFAEKFLANADRGLDRSTSSRDAIDLAFMVQAWPREAASAGYAVAVTAYGEAVPRLLAQAMELLADRRHRASCIAALAISDTATLARGLRRLGSFLADATHKG